MRQHELRCCPHRFMHKFLSFCYMYMYWMLRLEAFLLNILRICSFACVLCACMMCAMPIHYTNTHTMVLTADCLFCVLFFLHLILFLCCLLSFQIIILNNDWEMNSLRSWIFFGVINCVHSNWTSYFLYSTIKMHKRLTKYDLRLNEIERLFTF